MISELVFDHHTKQWIQIIFVLFHNLSIYNMYLQYYTSAVNYSGPQFVDLRTSLMLLRNFLFCILLPHDCHLEPLHLRLEKKSKKT